MELEAWDAGRVWTDHDESVSPAIGAFMRAWNDGLDDAERDRVIGPFRGRLLFTRGSDAAEERRSFLALDWLIRVHTPAFLDLTESLRPHATSLRALPEIRDLASAHAAGDTVRAARAAAWDAAWDAARDAARAAAWDAAWDAARAAAGAAARAAAGAAAWDAARAAAWDAARAAAGDALRPVVESLQTSAADLIERMLAVGDSGGVL